MRPHNIGYLGALLLLSTPTLLAQEGERPEESIASTVASNFEAWDDTHGSGWHTYPDVQTGYAQFIFGGNAPAFFEPNVDEDYLALGRLAIEDSFVLHGIESGTLVDDSGLHLPLGLIGSTDKYTTKFRQEVSGVPVLGGYVNALFTIDGRMLSVQTTAMPGVAGMSTDAAMGADRAGKIALEAFEAKTGMTGSIIDGPAKRIAQLEIDIKTRSAVLIWQVNVQWYEQDFEPEGYEYWIDANTGAVLREETSIHNFDVGGTVSTMATSGILPDQGNNPEISRPANHFRVNGGAAGTVITDQNGNFNFPGVTGPINITVDYYGDWANVNNQNGADYALTTSINGTGNNVLMNPSSNALITGQANCSVEIGVLRDWTRSVNPSDGHADFRALANANINSNCNAYYNGNSVNFYTAGGGCANSAYSTVIVHEMAHWFNVLYGTGNGSDGMGEGNGDSYSLLVYNTPNLGADFFGQGSGTMRSGNNMRQFCGDSNPGCYGQVHTDGEVWMGAVWKVYKELLSTHGAAMADQISDAIFLGWMNAYNQTQIRSVIETQWLTLDDNNGNINDGTPNYNDIDTGFKIQGFPGFDLPLISFISVTQLPGTLDEVGPYNVDVNVVPLVAPSISAVDLYYRVNHGAYTAISMSPSGVDLWSAGIPGQVSPAVVEYYVEATDSLSNTDTAPDEGASAPYRFVVGVETVLFADDFEGGNTGWTHASFGNTSNNQDDWQFGAPQGQSGDPSAAASGNNVWGNDLGGSGWNGAYQDNVNNYLRSPIIDCSTAVGTTLRFSRWLNVEESAFDLARIKVNGTLVWVNPVSGNTADNSWSSREYDISAIADGNSSVQIEFSLKTDAGLTFGGWTIDDVEVLFLTGSGGSCQAPTNYGTGKMNSQFNFPVLFTNGMPSESQNSFSIGVSGAVSNKNGLLFSGTAPANVPFFGGTRLVATPLTREKLFTTDVFGIAEVSVPVAPGSSGTTRYYQMWYRDPAHTDGTGVGLSDAVKVDFCD